MRRVVRSQLDPEVESKLRRRQATVNRSQAKGALDSNREWNNARRTKPLRDVTTVLKRMMGERERCMYCLDSHGTDIDHFWPKAPYPDRMFSWLNFVLSCTGCGRLKGDRFPLIAGQPALVDPTAEDPWQHLDFEPTTGNIVARFDVQANAWSEKGLKTVELLQLDRREALSAGYKKTLRALSRIVERALASRALDSAKLLRELREADEHGLLEWCFLGSGHVEAPFSELHANHRGVWNECAAILASPPRS